MTNKDIARLFNKLASLMELHGANPYKTRSYSNAYIQLRKLSTPLSEMSDEEIGSIKGVGKSLASKIKEILETGSFVALNEFLEKTPVGVQEMLDIKGFGAKKIKTIWKELGTETLGELLYACNENRLVALNGFGHKTQKDLIKKIEYYLQSRDKFHYATLEASALELVKILQKKLPTATVELTGEIRRYCPILNKIEIIIGLDEAIDSIFDKKLTLLEQQENKYAVKIPTEYPTVIYHYPLSQFGSKQFSHTGSRAFLEGVVSLCEGVDFSNLSTEVAVFEKAGLPYIMPELRENAKILSKTTQRQPPALLEEKEIKGVIHSHTTYSDGINTLTEMAEYAQSLGYEYIVITDHSKAAFYANGLKPDRVLAQMEEIDALNEQLAPFKIYKGIESDILNDGSLDYEEDILARFDFIIASVHTNLKMDETKATERLLTAIKNPYTTMLGHPTGRLLLSREGYPIDHKAIIDACSEHQVAIELNANPYRLDLDWTWIEYAMSKNVKISINPDAHSTGGIHDIHFGVLAARKGGLTAEMCFNTMGSQELDEYIAAKKEGIL
ncbi:MAG: PHP domain-containing protein [Saprospiraceae bacterium]